MATTKPPKTPDLNKKEVRQVLRGEHNSRGRGRSESEKRESYAKYHENKKKAIELESRNFQHLVLWPASDKDTNEKYHFYNMGGNSAIIYVHEIGPRIKRKPVLRIDMDNGDDKFHSGICSVSDVDLLEEKLSEIGVKRMATTKGYEDFIIYKLNREYTRTEIREMLKQQQRKLDTLNKVLYANVLFPDIHRQILDLKKIIPSKVKNMDKTYREVVGMEMIKTLMALIRAYSQMTHGDIDEKEGGRQMLLELDMLFAEVSMLNELKLWDVSTCIRVAEIVAGAKQLIKGKIMNKHEADK